VKVAARATADHGKLALIKAATVTIRIHDPQRLLGSANEIAVPLVVGVRDRYRRMHRAREIATEGATHILQVDVPYGEPLSVWIHSWRFRLTDARGAVVSRTGGESPFQVARGDPAPAFTFTIGGEAVQ
jgi:hypothetical protein